MKHNFKQGNNVKILKGYYEDCTGIIKHIWYSQQHVGLIADIFLDDIFTSNNQNKVISQYLDNLKIIKKMNRNGANKE